MTPTSSPHITRDIAAIVKCALNRGYYQHQIASVIGCNQGRISEIKTGKMFADVPPANDLPDAFVA